MSETTPSRDERLVTSLFPDSTTVGTDGQLSIGGVALADLAEEFGTPAYVFDVAHFRDRARRLREGLEARWPNSEVLFASKSLPVLALYELAADSGLSIDVAGEGEIQMALAAGVDPARLYFHGNAKTDAELELALRAGVGTIMVDNVDELNRLERLATSPQGVMVRVIPGISPRTHPSQATGGRESKFGLPMDQAISLLKALSASRFLRLRGVHLHIGSQILDVEPFAEAVRQIAAYGELEVYDVGGGLGSRYTYDEDPPSIEAYLDAITAVAREVLPASAKLLIEPGRSLVAQAGVSTYRIVSVKHTGRNFVALDGGMADNLDIALTGQRYEAAIDGKANQTGETSYVVVGRQCESGDQLIDGINLPDPRVGELLVIPVTGAYAFTMANNYNGARIPPVIFVEEGRANAAVRRQTFEDVLALHRSMKDFVN